MKKLFIFLAACMMAVGAMAESLDFWGMTVIILLVIAYVFLVRIYCVPDGKKQT